MAAGGGKQPTFRAAHGGPPEGLRRSGWGRYGGRTPRHCTRRPTPTARHPRALQRPRPGALLRQPWSRMPDQPVLRDAGGTRPEPGDALPNGTPGTWHSVLNSVWVRLDNGQGLCPWLRALGVNTGGGDYNRS